LPKKHRSKAHTREEDNVIWELPDDLENGTNVWADLIHVKKSDPRCHRKGKGKVRKKQFRPRNPCWIWSKWSKKSSEGAGFGEKKVEPSGKRKRNPDYLADGGKNIYEKTKKEKKGGHRTHGKN